jgi:hypothetical protein
MTAVGYWVRAELRRRRRAVAALVVLTLLATVVPMAAAAGARRTATALDRMRAELEPFHADVQFEGGRPRVTSSRGFRPSAASSTHRRAR